MTPSEQRRRCARCPVEIPAERTLCYFHVRSERLIAKVCLRCHRALPLDWFANHGRGRFRICDDCRWSHPMTKEEALEAARRGRLEWKWRHIHSRRLYDREYQQRRAA